MEATSNGDKYYEENIFPKIDEGKNSFNWYAALFGIFWFPYKGLWKTWAMWYMPFIFFTLLFELGLIPGAEGAYLGGIIGFVIGIGQTANKSYRKEYKKMSATGKTLENGHVGYGVAGIVAYLAIHIFVEGFIIGFVGGLSGNYSFNQNYITVPELIVDYSSYTGEQVTVYGVLTLGMGDSIVGLSSDGAGNILFADISQLSRDDRLDILNECDFGCDALLNVTPSVVLGERGVQVLSIVD